MTYAAPPPTEKRRRERVGHGGARHPTCRSGPHSGPGRSTGHRWSSYRRATPRCTGRRRRTSQRRTPGSGACPSPVQRHGCDPGHRSRIRSEAGAPSRDTAARRPDRVVTRGVPADHEDAHGDRPGTAPSRRPRIPPPRTGRSGCGRLRWRRRRRKARMPYTTAPSNWMSPSLAPTVAPTKNVSPKFLTGERLLVDDHALERDPDVLRRRWHRPARRTCPCRRRSCRRASLAELRRVDLDVDRVELHVELDRRAVVVEVPAERPGHEHDALDTERDGRPGQPLPGVGPDVRVLGLDVDTVSPEAAACTRARSGRTDCQSDSPA